MFKPNISIDLSLCWLAPKQKGYKDFNNECGSIVFRALNILVVLKFRPLNIACIKGFDLYQDCKLECFNIYQLRNEYATPFFLLGSCMQCPVFDSGLTYGQLNNSLTVTDRELVVKFVRCQICPSSNLLFVFAVVPSQITKKGQISLLFSSRCQTIVNLVISIVYIIGTDQNVIIALSRHIGTDQNVIIARVD